MRKHLSYSNVIATLCLFVVLGGGAYAASKLPKNSVKSKQIKNGQVKNADLKGNAVTTDKVKNASLKAEDLAAGVLPDDAPTTLPSGESLSGVYSEIHDASGDGDIAGGAYNFALPLASSPQAVYVPIDTAGPNPNPTACPGSVTNPEAAEGFLCVYENSQIGNDLELLTVGDPATNEGNTGNRRGFEIRVVATEAGTYGSFGTWAVTAP